MEMELRVNPTSIKTNEDGSMTVSGYVNKTEQKSNMLGRTQKFTEVIKRGAWQKAIDAAKEIHFLAEHDNKKILASTRNGSLQLREDDQGLYMEATISPTSWGKDYYQLIKDGILQNMSFGFRAIKDSWRNMGDHFERTVNDLELFEVSVVRDPAYSSSTISARGIDLVEDAVPDSELNLRTIEIRSDEDIEAIAKKLFEYISNNAKVAEQQDPKKDEEVEETLKEDPQPNVENKDKVVEDEPEVKDEPETDDDKSKDEEETKTEDEVKDEDPVDDNIKAAARIRDFINEFKENN